jgi:hypothetical protein
VRPTGGVENLLAGRLAIVRCGERKRAGQILFRVNKHASDE